MDRIQKLIADWQLARAEISRLERSEHPDITDSFSRVWVWKGCGDIYVHCGCAVPEHMIPEFGLPSQSALDNPNYVLCDICINGRKRNIAKCLPEWNCNHAMCKE